MPRTALLTDVDVTLPKKKPTEPTSPLPQAASEASRRDELARSTRHRDSCQRIAVRIAAFVRLLAEVDPLVEFETLSGTSPPKRGVSR
jgi:hypothetical protein